jgi:N-hydroxyarylamine O-acetyltransferase
VPSKAIDLNAYFARIGYAGDTAPTLAVLRALHLAHAEGITFENLDPLRGADVNLDAAAVDDKIIRRGRGGYCYEQNLLFKAALETLGFRVRGLIARVLWGRPEGVISARSHMLLLVDLDEGPYIADVGFGILTLTAPLRLDTEAPQETPHERFRLLQFEPGNYRMEAEVAGTWRGLYRFDLQPQYQADYDVANYYASTAPISPFVTGIMVARPAAGRRYALGGHRFSIHHVSGPSEQRDLTTVAEMRKVLAEEFLIPLPDDPALDAALKRLVES